MTLKTRILGDWSISEQAAPRVGTSAFPSTPMHHVYGLSNLPKNSLCRSSTQHSSSSVESNTYSSRCPHRGIPEGSETETSQIYSAKRKRPCSAKEHQSLLYCVGAAVKHRKRVPHRELWRKPRRPRFLVQAQTLATKA